MFKSIPSEGKTLNPTFPDYGFSTNPSALNNTIFEHLQYSQNQILNSNNSIWSSKIPRNQPTEEVIASVPIVGEDTSRERANRRKRSRNGRELLTNAPKKSHEEDEK